jgi:F-type H+-transporting ATPase subunit b
MIWNLFSFFLNKEEAFIELNPNILETNVINILILIGLLVYGYKTSFSSSLEARQKEIIQTIENAQKDVINASNYYELVEKGFSQSLFWLQSWKSFYQKEKIDAVNNKYNIVKLGLKESFSTSENLIKNFENKAFISLKRYIILLTASKILRKFLMLSDKEQLKLIELTIAKIGGNKK